MFWLLVEIKLFNLLTRMFVCLFTEAPPPLVPISPPDKGAIQSNSFRVKLAEASDDNGKVRYESHRRFQAVKFQHYKIFKMHINRIIKQNWAQVNSTLVWNVTLTRYVWLPVRVDERKKEAGERDKASEWKTVGRQNRESLWALFTWLSPPSTLPTNMRDISPPSILFLILLVLNV